MEPSRTTPGFHGFHQELWNAVVASCAPGALLQCLAHAWAVTAVFALAVLVGALAIQRRFATGDRASDNGLQNADPEADID